MEEIYHYNNLRFSRHFIPGAFVPAGNKFHTRRFFYYSRCFLCAGNSFNFPAQFQWFVSAGYNLMVPDAFQVVHLKVLIFNFNKPLLTFIFFFFILLLNKKLFHHTTLILKLFIGHKVKVGVIVFC
ncbi:hypothetical protein ACJIZ3_003540 [Penstemon smallii]|uniref:Uncharacterized protein n=1 Tax=Penstemon smallii TaxID=265156 RepID=A0ABD3U9I6_9LAMI